MYWLKKRAAVTQKFSQVMDTLQSRVLTASQTLNQVTGYTSIEAIKADNEALEASLAAAHARLRAARQAYKSSNARRAATQREEVRRRSEENARLRRELLGQGGAP